MSNNYDVSNVKVNRYLTYGQIQAIVNSVKNSKSWAERQQDIDMLMLHYATNIPNEELEKQTHDHWLQSGIVDYVRESVVNYKDIDVAIQYEENLMRLLVNISNELPAFNDAFKTLQKKENATIKK